jgi:hypothetical protein
MRAGGKRCSQNGNDNMNMKESGFPAAAQQQELIAKYCGDIAIRIRTASSRQQAAMLAAETCQSFENHCPSEIIRLFLNKYVEDLFNQYWKEVK